MRKTAIVHPKGRPVPIEHTVVSPLDDGGDPLAGSTHGA
jgi:hypothetical protein